MQPELHNRNDFCSYALIHKNGTGMMELKIPLNCVCVCQLMELIPNIFFIMYFVDGDNSGSLNTLRPGQNGRHFVDDTFKRIFLNENVRISIKISLKFASKGPINNIPTLVQIMAWRRPGGKPLSEPMMVRLPTHICATRPQWVDMPC